MSIHKHHARNAKRTLFIAIIVWIIVVIGLLWNIKKEQYSLQNKEILKLIGILLPAFGLLIYSFIEKRRAKTLKQDNCSIGSY